jgi:UDP-glucose 4-epimerase
VSGGPVLVTGGAGFIGSALVRALRAQGRRVVVYDDFSFGRRERWREAPELELVVGDVRDAGGVAAAVRAHQPSAVVHLAALHFIPYCNAHPVEAVDVNVNGTRAVLAACRGAAGLDKIVFASTAAVYPVRSGPLAEDGPLGPMDVYGHTKLAGEDLARLFALESGVPTVVARFFNAYGRGETNPHLIPEIQAQARRGGAVELGNLDPVRDYVHVDDLSAGLVALLGHAGPRFDVVNIGSGEGRSVRDVLAAFERALGRPLPVVQHADRIRPVERPELVADVGKLARLTGWRPRVAFADGIRDLLDETA